jgi:hypothetical protein
MRGPSPLHINQMRIKSGVANLMADAKMPLTLARSNLTTKHCMQDERGKALIEASKVHWVVWPR